MAKTSKLELIMQLSDKLFNNKLSQVQAKLGAAADKMQGRLNRLKNESLASFSKIAANGSGIGNMFRDAIDQVPFVGLLKNPLVLAGAAAGNAIRLGIEQDLRTTSFKVLLNSEEAAKKMVTDITKYGAETPYNKIGLGHNAKIMLSFGIDETKIMPTLKSIGDIAMGDANKMSSLTLAFSQMASTGKLTGQDLLQMINAGFNPLNEISKTTGKSIGDLKKEMEEGKISSDMITNAFMKATEEGGQFNNMAKKMGETMGGKTAQLMDNLNEKFLIFYEAIQPAVMILLDFTNAILDSVGKGLTWFFKELKDGNPLVGILSGFILALITAITAYTIVVEGMTLATKLWAATQILLNTAMTLNPIGLIVAAIAAVIALVYMAITKWDEWGAALTVFMGPIGLVIGMFKSLYDHWDSIKKAFQTDGIIGGIKRIGIVLLNALLKPVQQLLELLAKIPGMGGIAGAGAKMIEQLRTNLDLVTPGEKEAKAKAGDMGAAKTKPLTQSPDAPKGDGTGDSKKTDGDVNKVAGQANQVRKVEIKIDAFNKGGINVAQSAYAGMTKDDVEAWFKEMMRRVVINAEAAG